MNIELISSAFAQGAGETTRGSAPIWPMLLAIFAVFYFFIIRPQQKKQKETQNMLGSLAKGSRVVTIGGICGTVVNIKDKKGSPGGEDIVVLKVGDNVKLDMIRSSIAKVLPKEDEQEKEKS